VLIISSDKDLMQLVGPKVRFYDFESGSRASPATARAQPRRGRRHREMGGHPPEKIGDVLALMGDTSDNVPGVPGIGLKTAAQLIREYGDLETLLERASEIKQPKRRETLIANADTARLSKKLVTLDCEAPLPVSIDELRLTEPDPKPLIGFLKAWSSAPSPAGSRSSTGRTSPPSRPTPRHARRRGDRLDPRGGHRRPGAVLRRGEGAAPRARWTPSRIWACPRTARPARPALKGDWEAPRRWCRRASRRRRPGPSTRGPTRRSATSTPARLG
jgi:hypothetical protein